MSDTDQSILNLRYNQVSKALEGFGGGSPQWTELTLTNVDPTQVPVTRLINTTSPLTGGGNLSTDRTIAIPVATGAVNGYLSAADWTTFNSKQAAGSYITALTGDVTATGPGSSASTLATVNSDVGSFTSASITVDAKGRITAAASGSSIVPGGANTQIQYNDSGAFGASSQLAFAPGVLTIPVTLRNLAAEDLEFEIGAVGLGSINLNGLVGLRSDPPGEASLVEITGTTTTQRDASTPNEGALIYNVTTHKLNFWNGSAWEAVVSA